MKKERKKEKKKKKKKKKNNNNNKIIKKKKIIKNKIMNNNNKMKIFKISRITLKKMEIQQLRIYDCLVYIYIYKTRICIFIILMNHSSLGAAFSLNTLEYEHFSKA